MPSRLIRFLARRLLFAFLLVFIVSSGALLLARLAPGDVTSELAASGFGAETLQRERVRAGLDRSALDQYLDWLGRTMRLDFGRSLRYGRPVNDLVLERAANTLVLAVAALALAIGIGLPLGVLSGSRPTGWGGAIVRVVSVVALSLPPLATSLGFALLAARTGWFPVGGMQSPGFEGAGPAVRLGDLVWHALLPSAALALPIAAMVERLQAQSLSEMLREPFILAATARGVPERRVIWRHALRPSLKPVVATFGLVLGSLLSGSFIVEIVMAWPGLGRLMYEALVARDVYLVAGCAAAGALFLAVGTLVSDIILALTDPRMSTASGI
jgi:peptide/nickel transport system permease protein